MSALSDYLEGKLMDLVFNATAYAAPVTLTLALYKTDPTDANTGIEVAVGDDANYVRQAITFGAQAGGVVSNDAVVTFPSAASGASYTVSHIAIFDQLDNMLWHGPLGTPAAPVTKTMAFQESLSFPVGALACSLS